MNIAAAPKLGLDAAPARGAAAPAAGEAPESFPEVAHRAAGPAHESGKDAPRPAAAAEAAAPGGAASPCAAPAADASPQDTDEPAAGTPALAAGDECRGLSLALAMLAVAPAAAAPPAAPAPPAAAQARIAGSTALPPFARGGEAAPAAPASPAALDVTALAGATADAAAATTAAAAPFAEALAQEAGPVRVERFDPVAGLVERGPSSPADARPASSPAPAVPLRTDAADWGRALGERLLWSARQGQSQAQLELHPRELGAVEVRIRIDGDRASLWFTAATPQAREALEAAMPALRERFQAEGLGLAQAEVSRDGPGGRPHEPPPAPPPRAWTAAGADAPDALPAGQRLHLGLIDDYA